MQKMEQSSCTEDRIQHVLERCLCDLGFDTPDKQLWNGKTQYHTCLLMARQKKCSKYETGSSINSRNIVHQAKSTDDLLKPMLLGTVFTYPDRLLLSVIVITIE